MFFSFFFFIFFSSFSPYLVAARPEIVIATARQSLALRLSPFDSRRHDLPYKVTGSPRDHRTPSILFLVERYACCVCFPLQYAKPGGNIYLQSHYAHPMREHSYHPYAVGTLSLPWISYTSVSQFIMTSKNEQEELHARFLDHCHYLLCIRYKVKGNEFRLSECWHSVINNLSSSEILGDSSDSSQFIASSATVELQSFTTIFRLTI